MLYDTLQTMRRINKTLANDVARGFCQLLKAMTSQERSSISTIGPYLEFREIDVGKT
jgi:aristolochene synthase